MPRINIKYVKSGKIVLGRMFVYYFNTWSQIRSLVVRVRIGGSCNSISSAQRDRNAPTRRDIKLCRAPPDHHHQSVSTAASLPPLPTTPAGCNRPSFDFACPRTRQPPPWRRHGALRGSRTRRRVRSRLGVQLLEPFHKTRRPIYDRN